MGVVMKDAEAIGERGAMEPDRTVATEAHTQSQGRTPSYSGSSGVNGDRVRAEDGNTVGRIAAGNGLRKRDDVLAAIAGMEHSGGVGSGAASDSAGTA